MPFFNEKSVGPTYFQIAQKYEQKPEVIDYLTDKIISGGSGVWGQSPMSAHPQLTKKNVNKMVEYILSLKDSRENIE